MMKIIKFVSMLGTASEGKHIYFCMLYQFSSQLPGLSNSISQKVEGNMI